MQSYKEVIDSTEYRIIVEPRTFKKAIKGLQLVDTDKPKSWNYVIYSESKVVGRNLFPIRSYDQALADAKFHIKGIVNSITARYPFAETQSFLSKEALVLTGREALALFALVVKLADETGDVASETDDLGGLPPSRDPQPGGSLLRERQLAFDAGLLDGVLRA